MGYKIKGINDEAAGTNADAQVIMTEAPLNPKSNREKMVKVFMEDYGFKGMYVGITAVLALFGASLVTGCVVDIGDGVTHVVPVVEGYALPHAIRRLDVAGRDLTKYMARMLSEQEENKGRYFTTSAEQEIAAYIKIEWGVVSLQYEEDLATYESPDMDKYWEMPDKQRIKIASQQFRVTEPLFTPSLIGVEQLGVVEMIADAIKACDVDTRVRLFESVVISGGSACFDKLSERIEQDVPKEEGVYVGTGGVVVINKPSSARDPAAISKIRDLVWGGAKAISQLETFKGSDESKQLWYTRDSDYAAARHASANVWDKLKDLGRS
jgi:actin-related protein